MYSITTTTNNGLVDKHIPSRSERDGGSLSKDRLSVFDRTRASSLVRERGQCEGEGEEEGGRDHRRRSRSQPHEYVGGMSGENPTNSEAKDFSSSGGTPPGQPCSIPIKTHIIGTIESERTTMGVECGQETGAEVVNPPEKNPELTKHIEEAKKKMQELREKTRQWSRRFTQVHALTMHTAASRKDNDTPAAVTSLHISRDHRRLFVGDSRGRVFSWTVSDTQGGVMEHWLRDETVDKCMKCGVEFTFTERKHHCRDCGKIFCHRCSGFESEVKRLRIFKKVRVCEDCYKNLRPKQSPKF